MSQNAANFSVGTDNAIARYDTTAGSVLQDSGVTISDTGVILDQNAIVGGTLQFRIHNDDDTNSASDSCVDIRARTGDPYLKISISATDTYVLGIDTSADETLKLNYNVNNNVTPSSGTELLTITKSGASTFTGDVITPGLELNSSSNIIMAVKRTITNSEIKALNTTPITLVSAPAAGKAISVISTTVRFNYGGSNVFVSGGNLTIAATNASGQVQGSINPAIYTGSVDKVYAVAPGNAVGSATINTLEAQPIVLTTATSNPTGNAANDNTMDVSVLYQIITL